MIARAPKQNKESFVRIDWEIKLGFKDVLIKPKRSVLRSRADVSLLRQFKFKHSEKTWEGIPIIAANMDSIGTFDMANQLGKQSMMTAIHKHYQVEEWDKFLIEHENHIYPHIMLSTGISDRDLNKAQELLIKHPPIQFICIDVANGYTEHFVDFLKKIREKFSDKVIVAGNVVTPEMTEELILSGADIIKVGIGPGSVCTTRVKTGVGFPQLSAIMECADAAHGLSGHVVSDGGCNSPGDVAKAFAAGADFVMLGGLFSGHDESGGSIISVEGKKYKEFYGMSSKAAMEKHSGGVANYRSSEGKSVQVPYKGPVENTIKDILGGIRSTCTYVGAAKLKELSKRTTFVRVCEQENTIFT